MIRSGPSGYQTSHAQLRRLLHKIMMDSVQAGRGATGGIGSVPLRASAALYALLLTHPLDQQGRCRACRSPGAVFGRRRRCWVHLQANYWLRQPEEFLHSRVADEWGLANRSPPRVGAAPDSTAAATQPLQTPVAPPTPTLPVGRPDLDHGEAGDDPDGLRSRRGPSKSSPGPARAQMCSPPEVSRGQADCYRGHHGGAERRALGRGPAPSLPGIELVDALTQLAHRVSPEELLAGRARGDYEAFCGARFLTASLIDPGQGHCPACAGAR